MNTAVITNYNYSYIQLLVTFSRVDNLTKNYVKELKINALAFLVGICVA